MPPEPRGSVFKAKRGYGIRWPEQGRRPQKTGFETKRAAREWFDKEVKPRLRRGGPSPEVTFEDFCALFLDRHGARVAQRTCRTLEERLGAARTTFGAWRLAELEYADADIVRWRATLPEGSRFRATKALRQVFAAAVRWHYLDRNPALAEPNSAHRREELEPFTPEEIAALAEAPIGPVVVFAAETGLRTNEWIALERRDIDRASRSLLVHRRYAHGVLTPFPKTQGSRRRVPLTARALGALDAVVPRLDTALVFPAPGGQHHDLSHWRNRSWYPALDAAGIRRRGPYHLRHTFATEALAAGISVFELARVMGSSVAMIDATYGHLAADADERIRRLLEARRLVEGQ